MGDSRKYIARTRYTQLYVELLLAIANIADRKAIREKERKKNYATADLNFSITRRSRRRTFRSAPRRSIDRALNNIALFQERKALLLKLLPDPRCVKLLYVYSNGYEGFWDFCCFMFADTLLAILLLVTLRARINHLPDVNRINRYFVIQFYRSGGDSR